MNSLQIRACEGQEKGNKRLLRGLFALWLLLFFLGFSYVKQGFFVLANAFLDFLTGKTGTIYLDYPAQGEKGLTFTLVLLGALALLVLSKALRDGLFWLALLVAVPYFLGVLAGLFPANAWLLVPGIGLLFFVLRREAKGRLKPGQVKNLSAVLLLLLTCGAVILGFSLTKTELSTRYGVEAVKEALHELRYRCGDTAMPEGKLSNLGGFEKSEETALEITMEEPQKLYLRGLIGEVYTGTSWESLDGDSRKEAEDLFYWLHKSGFYGQTSIAEAARAVEEPEGLEMQIANRGACGKYQYLPYALAAAGTLDASLIGDGSTLAEGQVQNLTYYAGSVPEWYETSLALYENQNQEAVESYLKQEQSYREWVYQEDLQLTNAAIGVCRRLLGEDTAQMSLSEIQELIRSTLESKLEYNEIVTTGNGKNDFFQYTMEQSKKGYSVHYATAATLLFRYCGVPARYVEGYFLSRAEAETYESGEVISLDESHAHAWTEYYLDGVGWVPFEVTPGYVDEEEIAALTESMENGEERTGGNGKSFSRSRQLYTPPVYPEEKTERTELSSLFHFQTRQVLLFLLVVVVLLLLWGLFVLLRRRRRLLQALEQMEQMENREAIMAQFAYASMLLERGKTVELPDYEKVYQINQEAIFSPHVMTDEQRKDTEDFTKEVLEACKAVWSRWKKFRYHYISWIYR